MTEPKALLLFGQPIPEDCGPHNCVWIDVPDLPLQIRFRDELRELARTAPAIVQRMILDASPRVFSWGIEAKNQPSPLVLPGERCPEPKFIREGLELSLERAVDEARAELHNFLLDTVDKLRGFEDENDPPLVEEES